MQDDCFEDTGVFAGSASASAYPFPNHPGKLSGWRSAFNAPKHVLGIGSLKRTPCHYLCLSILNFTLYRIR